MKKVVLMVVDALASRVVLPALERGTLPNLNRLVDRGQVVPGSIAVFPSITPAATASIVTGRYPAEHGIAGAFWLDEEKNDVAYYGDDFWVILNEGFSNFFEDFLVRLNGDRLQATTAFEIIEESDRTAGCLNYLWFRGLERHQVRVPFLISLLPWVSRKQSVMGPHTLSLGDFVSSNLDIDRKPIDSAATKRARLLRRYGFEDRTTSAELVELVRSGAMPDFTLAYFPDNDYESHKAGPEEAFPVLKKFDDTLGKLIEACGGIEPLLEEFIFVITGDHSQSDLLEEDDTGICLDELLEEFAIATPGEPWSDGDEIMICPNMRAAQIYFHDNDPSMQRKVESRLLGEERVDQVIFQSSSTDSLEDEFNVLTSDRGRLRFWRAEEPSAMGMDRFGNSWSWEGDLAAIDAHHSPAEKQISFGNYPNALERIAMSFGKQAGGLWTTAKLGYEFRVKEVSEHPRGSHGSLHELDSTSPLIVCGAPQGFSLPTQTRAVDVLPVCLELLGIDHELVHERLSRISDAGQCHGS